MLFSFGVDDIDGIIDDMIKIYSMVGLEEQILVMSIWDLVNFICCVGREFIERDMFYNVIQDYIDYVFEEDE